MLIDLMRGYARVFHCQFPFNAQSGFRVTVAQCNASLAVFFRGRTLTRLAPCVNLKPL